MSGKINGTNGGSQPQQVGASGAAQAARGTSGSTGATASAAATGASAGSTGAAGTGAGADKVDITGAASELATAEQSLNLVPVVNESRVSSIRGAIEAGTYRVQPQKVANKLVEFERDLPRVQDTDSSDAA